jgi:DNA polymerase III epsilon subunit-like protein
MSKNNFYSGNVLDFEASGLGQGSYPIEVGIVLNNGHAYHSLISPCLSWTHWTQSAENIHGISREDLTRYGKPLKQVCEEMNTLCAGQTLYSDCWVLDSQWLSRLFGAAGMHPSFQLSPMEYFLSEQELSDWGRAKKQRAEQENIKLHRALHDAFVIKSLLDDKLAKHSNKTWVNFEPSPSAKLTVPMNQELSKQRANLAIKAAPDRDLYQGE